MKKRIILIALVAISVLATIFTLCACIFLNAFFGNPISYLAARVAAESYVDDNYPSLGYEIEDVRYSFKDGSYHAYVSSEEHVDGDFTVYLNSFGGVDYDDYSYRVEERGNVSDRLFLLYRARVGAVLESKDFPYECHIAYGNLEFDREVGEGLPEGAMDRSELINGAEYDIDELGKTNGTLVLYVDTDRADISKASEILLEVRRIMDEAGVTFARVDLTVRVSDISGNPSVEFSVLDFEYEDIYEDGMDERVISAKERTDAYFERMSDEKAAEMPIE